MFHVVCKNYFIFIPTFSLGSAVDKHFPPPSQTLPLFTELLKKTGSLSEEPEINVTLHSHVEDYMLLPFT